MMNLLQMTRKIRGCESDAAAQLLLENYRDEWIDGRKLWLWRNFVDGKPEYWAFDNGYPCQAGGDPMTLGEPCGYAILKNSHNGRPEVSDEQILAAAIRALKTERE